MNDLVSSAAARLAGVLLASLSLAASAITDDFGDTPYVQTPMNVVERMLEIAKVGPTDYVVDLGSGDGRMVITAAKKYGARGFGVDLDNRLVVLANRNAARMGVSDRAVFYRRDLHETNVSPATVMSIYLLPEVNLMIRARLLATLKPGTRIVSHDYGMGDWQADASEDIAAPGKKVGIGQRSKILYYVVPGNAAGRWRWQLAVDGKPVEFDVSIQQTFQMLEGTFTAGGQKGKIEKGRLTGEQIDFSATVNGVAYEFSGRIYNHAIEGKAKLVAGGTTGGTARELPWSATRVELWDTRHAGITREQAIKEMH
jgi:hypothetical protein